MTDFEKYTDRARRVVLLAQDEARMLNHNYLGTEHLLLGMLQEGEGVAAVALAGLGVTLEAARQEVEVIIGRGQQRPTGELPFTLRAQRVLGSLAFSEAVKLSHQYVGTEHLLLAVIQEGQGVAVQALTGPLGISLDRTRQEVLYALLGSAPEPSLPDSPTLPPAPHQPPLAHRPLLGELARDLGREAAGQELFPVVGRTAEIERIAQVLSRRQRNVPLLVGDPGVGKASVVAGLAHAVAAGTAPAVVAGRKVYSLDVGALFTDPQHHGRFAELMSGLLAELQQGDGGGLVLFLDNAFTVLHTSDGRAEALAFFRPVLRSPGVSVIAACTASEFRRRDPDPGLDEFLQPLEIGELSTDEVREVLAHMRPRLEQHHGVAITDEALRAAAELARDHLPGQALPGSAIDLLDQASAVAGTRRVVEHADPVAAEYEQRLTERRGHLDSATASQDLVLAGHYAEEIERLTAALAEHRRRTAPEGPQGLHVTAAEVTEALTTYAGVPDTPAPRTPARPARSGPHDPSVWSMS
ncbi:Clp protease N-terminal domain-containing protein [Streptomyces sp. CB01881]|uniref:Clp protease N-terminal domain-containing protein n=1 Tax=Streptomyces sp. CB01881 TaxID=2078691 RepID=UPI000CDBA651|nr:Clp protease N-terminal domain-containing protein [Streptomyces sp. CB01881]AUY49157.1 hypothetical protein C2142_09645 [Streptomyces sp. CB01881]TYC77649.1 hypothetical protein EH183_09650 [Streptomyces sp. CB01881]